MLDFVYIIFAKTFCSGGILIKSSLILENAFLGNVLLDTDSFFQLSQFEVS